MEKWASLISNVSSLLTLYKWNYSCLMPMDSVVKPISKALFSIFGWILTIFKVNKICVVFKAEVETTCLSSGGLGKTTGDRVCYACSKWKPASPDSGSFILIPGAMCNLFYFQDFSS